MYNPKAGTESEVTQTDTAIFDNAFTEITETVADTTTAATETETIADTTKETERNEEQKSEAISGDNGDNNTTADDDDSGGDGSANGTSGVADKPDELQALRDQLAALQARLEAKPEPEKQPEPAAVAAEEPKPVYSGDEEEKIKQYQEDWPEVVAGEALVRRKEYTELVNYIFDEVAKRYEPLIDFYQNSSSRNQYSDIVSLVPDYDVVRDKTLDWIETQPIFLKKAYTEVTETGSPEDIAALINIFKKETGYAATAATKSMPAATVTKTTNPAKAEAAAALKIVKSGRSSITEGQPDQADFDGSFSEAVRKNKK